MAGLYLHIPFCKSRCIYCSFYSTTLENRIPDYVEAVCREMTLRPSPFVFHTVYLGGGTPSLLPERLLRQLFEAMTEAYSIDTAEEVTIECNPEDVTEDFAEVLHTLPINRVSMGAQTFSDERLTFLRRRHDARQVRTAVERLRRAGIENISIDLMYGFPGESLFDWQQDIQEALTLDVEHLSAYCLSIDKGTSLSRMIQQQQVKPADEETCLAMYYLLLDTLKNTGYEHYEISNFAKPGFASRHNSGYWNGTPYWGLGAAAHSYDLSVRQWNVADVNTYIQALSEGHLPVEEKEVIDISTHYNDYVMTALRTRQGMDISAFRQQFPEKYYKYLMEQAKKHLEGQLLACDERYLRLTRKALFISDTVLSDLMFV